MNEKPQRGRPTIYSDELATEICRQLMIGKSLRKICQADDMPNIDTVMSWLASNRGNFTEQYTKARQIQAEYYLDEMMDIADDDSQDKDENGQFNQSHLNRMKLRIDTRKWTIEKLAPKKYGQRQQLDNTSSDKSMSAKPVFQIIGVSPNENVGDDDDDGV